MNAIAGHILSFVVAHHDWFISSGAVLTFAAGFVAKELPIFAKKEVSIGFQDLQNSKNPEIRVFGQDIEAAIVKFVPDAGDARYATAADKLLKELPPSCAIGRPIIISVLSGLASGAKAAASEAQQKQISA